MNISSLSGKFDYFGARYYANDLSVWLSVDPMSDKYPSTSPFAYVENNPIMFTDPNGLYPVHHLNVTMDDETVIRVTINTRKGQDFKFKIKGRRSMRFNYRSTRNDRKSLALLRDNTSREISINKKSTGDIDKMAETYEGYKISDILVKLAEQNSSVGLYVVGNHSVPASYYGNLLVYMEYDIQENNGDYSAVNLYYNLTSQEKYQYGNAVAIYKNRTRDIDSHWSQDRAQYIVNKFFQGSSYVTPLSRNDVDEDLIPGVKLNKFGHDPVGITIGVRYHRVRRSKKPDRHKTVLFL